MTVRTTNLGGTNWSNTENLTSADLNDTLNAMANLTIGMTAFYLMSSLRDLYDDFSGYTTDAAIAAGALYTSSNTGSGTKTFTCRASTNAGGTSKEGEFKIAIAGATSGTYTLKIIGLTANKHKYIKVKTDNQASSSSGGTSNSTTSVSFDEGSTSHTIVTSDSSGGSQEHNFASSLTTVTVIALGSNQYACYVGGKLVQTVTDASFNIWFTVSASSNAGGGSAPTATLYIADIYESAGTI